MKKIFTLLMALIVFSTIGVAQIFTSSPELLQESSTNVILTFHADSPLGNGAMKGLTESTPLYVHIGAITNLSTSTSDWKYANFPWPSSADDSKANTPKNRLTYVSPNTWTLNIGNIRSYFGINDPNEHVKKIAIVVRTAGADIEGKTASGGDIFVDVEDEGYQLKFTGDNISDVISAPMTVNLKAITTLASNITITVNGTKLVTKDNALDATTNYAIQSTGNYTFVATATANGKTLTKQISIAYPGASTAGTYPGGVPKMGAVKNSDGTVTFCIAAPGKTSAILVPSWDDYAILDKNIMKYQDYNGRRYFFTTVSGLKDNEYYPYYYIIDAKHKVADPYARLILDCYSDKWLDPSIWPDMPKYPYDKFDNTVLSVYRGDIESDFKFSNFNIPDPSNLVIYEMLFRDFTGDEGKANGNGTIRKAMEKLYYLKSLGVNAIELMPVMEFNGNNSWGYNTNFYFALDKAYGSPRDLKNFVEACHNLGMAVILDIALNHSDGLHPWYSMYDINSNPFFNKVAPHQYGVLNDWKQENPLVQQQWKDVLQFWLKTYNVDGFRFDLVKGLGTQYGSDTNAYNKSRVEVMKTLHAHLKAIKPNALHINENLAGTQEENEMAADGQYNWANINDNAAQFAMGFGERSNLNRFYASNDGNRTWGSTVAYAESHDEERIAYKQTKYGAPAVAGNRENAIKRLGQVAVQMLLMPGPKMIWQFGELGADQTTKNGSDNDTNPKTVIWSYLDDPDRKALHDTYAALCHFRTHNPTLFNNSATVTLTGFANSVTSNRIIRITNGDMEVMAFINPAISGANKTVGAGSTVLNANNCQLIAASAGFTPKLNGTSKSVSVSVPPHGYAVFATKNAAGVDNVITDNNSAVNVEGGIGEIIVNGDFDTLSVYDMQGRMQTTLEGQGSSLTMPAGLYIVTVDGSPFKVLVK